MNHAFQSEAVAVICDRASDSAPSTEAFLQAQGLTQAEWYAPRDVDDVDRAVRAGHIHRVIFADWTQLLDALWDERIAGDQWLASGMRVDIATPPVQTNAVLAEVVLRGWQRRQRRRRRRQLAAGTLLSVAALAAAFALLALRG